MKSISSVENIRDSQKQQKEQSQQLLSTKLNMIVIKNPENRKQINSSSGSIQNNNYNNNGGKNRGMDALISLQTKKIADRAETLW